jgi:hypothetical protein
MRLLLHAVTPFESPSSWGSLPVHGWLFLERRTRTGRHRGSQRPLSRWIINCGLCVTVSTGTPGSWAGSHRAFLCRLLVGCRQSSVGDHPCSMTSIPAPTDWGYRRGGAHSPSRVVGGRDGFCLDTRRAWLVDLRRHFQGYCNALAPIEGGAWFPLFGPLWQLGESRGRSAVQICFSGFESPARLICYRTVLSLFFVSFLSFSRADGILNTMLIA